jgi:hypothetical protein
VKHLQTLVWWVRDHEKHGLPLVAADFDIETMNEVVQIKVLSRELADKEPSVKELGKFDPDDFDAYEDAFLNLLAQSYGVLHEPLHYVICSEEVPEVFTTTHENSFELDNQAVYRKLKLSLSIRPDGRGLNPMMLWRMVELHTWHGQCIIMAKGNLANVRRLRKGSSIKLITGTSIA